MNFASLDVKAEVTSLVRPLAFPSSLIKTEALRVYTGEVVRIYITAKDIVMARDINIQYHFCLNTIQSSEKLISDSSCSICCSKIIYVRKIARLSSLKKLEKSKTTLKGRYYHLQSIAQHESYWVQHKSSHSALYSKQAKHRGLLLDANPHDKFYAGHAPLL